MFADITIPFISLLAGKREKRDTLDFGPEHQTVCEKLKTALLEAPALGHNQLFDRQLRQRKLYLRCCFRKHREICIQLYMLLVFCHQLKSH